MPTAPQTAFRYALAAAAAAAAAVIAHVAIDVAGDYVLARDAYDGVAHESRAIFIVCAAAVALVLGIRILFDLLDRSSTSTRSLLRGLRLAAGTPLGFVVLTAVLALGTLASMEWLDCALAGTPPDDVADLFGGSLALGPSITIACAAICGWIAHRLVCVLAEHEPAIAAILCKLLAPQPRLAAVPAERSFRTRGTRHRALLLARSGSKRGPPAAFTLAA